MEASPLPPTNFPGDPSRLCLPPATGKGSLRGASKLRRSPFQLLYPTALTTDIHLGVGGRLLPLNYKLDTTGITWEESPNEEPRNRVAWAWLKHVSVTSLLL